MKTILASLCLAILPAISQAAPASAESIEQLMAVTDSEKLVNGTMPQIERMMQASMEQVVAGRKMSTAQRQKADAFITAYMAKVRPLLRDELGWQKMKPIYVQVYSESFTQEEVDGLVAFYQSAAGKALVEKMPVVMQKTLAITQQKMVPIIEASQKIAADTLKELQLDKDVTK